EDALRKGPESREARFLVAALAQMRAAELMKQEGRDKADPLFLRSADLMRAVRKQAGDDLRPEESGLLRMAVYNEACCLALGGKPDEAMASLAEAYLELGADNYDDLDTDTDLVSLRERPAFAELKEKVAAKKEEARKLGLVAAREQARRALVDNRP